ncbi:MAG: hypothetical protein ACI8UO_005090 [Verrucomicrobiales bacterium]|jgi:hypothetical protein
MEALKLSVATILVRKTYFIWVAFLLVGTLVFPYLTPWEEKPSLLQPARAQTAWAIAWLFVLGWGLYQAASFGDKWAADGILDYLKSTSRRKFARLGQLWSTSLIFLGAFVLIAFGLSLATAMPKASTEAWMWVWTNLQYAWLFILAMGPLLLFATALGTRLNATAAYCLTAGLGIYGLFGIAYLDFFLSQTENAFFDFLFLISPHYHLADLSDRLVFKMGALDTETFLHTSAYLAGLGAIISSASYFLYRDRK